MINPLETASKIVSSILAVGSYTANQDLVLRQLVVTFYDLNGVGDVNRAFVISNDPDLTPLNLSSADEGFQLNCVAYVPLRQTARICFRDLAFPLLNGQTLYWFSEQDPTLTQLIFS